VQRLKEAMEGFENSFHLRFGVYVFKRVLRILRV